MAHVMGGIGHGKTVEEEIAQRMPRPAGPSLPEGFEGIPVIVNGQVIGWNIQGEFFTQEEVDALIATGKFPEEAKTGTTPRTEFESERRLRETQAQELRDRIALDRQRLEADIAATEQRLQEVRLQEDRADERQKVALQAEREMLEMRLENSRRELLFSEIGASTRTVFQAQEAERGRQQEMAGEDPFRFTATLRGRGVSGQTPVDVFKQQGQQFVNQQLPQFSINDPIPQLEAGLQALQKLSIGGAPQGLIPSLAHGGVIEMKKEKDGAFSLSPTTEQTFLVGDGAGIIPGVTEALTVSDEGGAFRLRVTPIAGTAQGGMDFNFSDLDLGGFDELLASLRRSTGLRPSALTDPGMGGFGTVSTGRILGKERASALGAFQIAPGTPVRASDSNAVYMIDETGRLRQYGSTAAWRLSGFTRPDVQTISPEALGRLERGPDITGAFNVPLPNFESAFQALGQPPSTRQGFLELAAVNPNFSEQDAIALANRIGFLPAPHKIARDFPLLDPAEQAGIISLYELAGFPEGSFMSAVSAATPQGRFSAGRRIGFTGASF